MRVCFLIDELAPAGTETQLLALIHRLDRRRVLPFLCLLRGESATSRAMEPDDCPVLRLNVGSLRSPASLMKAWRLRRFLRCERIDVLQVYFPDSTYFGVPVGRWAGVPAIVRTRNNVGHALRRVDRWLGRLLNRFTTATVANCDAARRSLLEAEQPRAESVIVLENGVDLKRFEAIAPLGTVRPGPLRRVGTVANLRHVKGLGVLIDAAHSLVRKYPDVTFQVAGEGPERVALEQHIRERGLEGRFRLLGSVADIPAFLGEIDIAVLPSRAEGMPNAVLEYMAAGRAVVASSVGACERLLDCGACGLLVPAEDSAHLAEAVGSLLDDHDLARRFGEAARRRTREHFSREAMVRRFEDFFASLVRHCP